MSSNIGLGKNSNTILVKQVSQQRDNNDASVSENMITNIRPSEKSSDSSLSSTTISNFEIPVHFNGPGLSSIYHETNKISDTDTNRLNEVNNLERWSGSDEGYQLGEFNRLSGSISEDGLNLVDGTGGSNERNEKGLRKESGGIIGENETYGVGNVDNYRGGHNSRKNNFVRGTGGSNEFSFEGGKRAKQGFIGEGETKEFDELSRDDGSRMFIGNGEDEKVGRDKGFSASVGSIQFGQKKYGRAGGSGGEEGGDRGFSRSNGSIRFGRKNKNVAGGSSWEEPGDREFSTSNGSIQFGRKNGGRAGGLEGEKGGDRRHSRSNGSIRFSRKNKSGTGRLGGEEEGNIGVGRSNGSIRLERKNGGRAGGSDEEEGGDRGFSKSNGSIRFSRKTKSGTGRLNGEEGDIGVGRSIGSMRFGREGGSGGEEEEEVRGFSGSVGSIRLGRKNKSGTSGSGGENIQFSEGQRTHISSIFRGDGKMNGSGGKRAFGGSVGTFGEESGDKGQSKSNSININRAVGNYGGGKFDSYIEGNGFSREYGTGEESNGAAFSKFGPKMGENLKWAD